MKLKVSLEIVYFCYYTTNEMISVWLVRPLQKNEDDDDETSNGGVLSHAQEMEFMEMAGKKMYSKDLGPDLSGKDKA